MKKALVVLVVILTFLGCDSGKLEETPDSKFVGKWVLSERSILDGVEIEISKDEKGRIQGVVTKLNENKYVQMFMVEGDVLLTGVARKSNFEFDVSEKKIAAPLFSQYGESTTVKFHAQFKGDDEVLLGKDGVSGSYLRIE